MVSEYLTFGKLARGDSEAAKPQLRRLLNISRSYTLLAQVLPIATKTSPRRLKVVLVRVYGTSEQAVLDTRAVPNFYSSQSCSRVGIGTRVHRPCHRGR